MIICLVGESSSGKSTIEKELIHRYGYKNVISYTTREPRDGEINNVDYHFISDNEFIEKNCKGFFTEIGGYNGWLYGSVKEDYTGKCVVVLTPHGLRQLKKNKELDLRSFYINVPRKDRFIKSLQRGNGGESAIEESKRRDSTDLGQYDGIEDDVDYTIENIGYEKSAAQICVEITKIIEDKKNKEILSYTE